MPASSKARRERQALKERYAKVREEAQLAGLVHTTPEGAVRDERAEAVRGDERLPAAVQEALRKGWAVPEPSKAKLVDELLALIDNPETPHKTKVAAFNALRLADKDQYERDNPSLARLGRGGLAIVNNVKVSTGGVFDDIERDVRLITGEVDCPADSDLPPHGAQQPVDAAQSHLPKEE